MRRGLAVALLSTCLLGILVESVVIRKWRHANAKIRGHTEDGRSSQTAPTSSQQPTAKVKRKGFRATHTRCCKIGEKVAKRKLACDVEMLKKYRQFTDMERAKLMYNRPSKFFHSKISAKLSTKLRKCSASFPKYFEKCCKYRRRFYKSMAKCKQRQGKERRKCRQSVRSRYQSPSSGRKKQRKPRRKRCADKQQQQ
ncbi:uncharacterized protein LOC143292459 [Babylonia areolata]|uniref:uncharacterized protein LOC143292459 n=1 Tax=Babylonia areolata TaxID=304850 RepID=UPI003FCF4B8C